MDSRSNAAKLPLVTGGNGSGAALARFVSHFLISGGPMTPMGRAESVKTPAGCGLT